MPVLVKDLTGLTDAQLARLGDVGAMLSNLCLVPRLLPGSTLWSSTDDAANILDPISCSGLLYYFAAYPDVTAYIIGVSRVLPDVSLTADNMPPTLLLAAPPGYVRFLLSVPWRVLADVSRVLNLDIFAYWNQQHTPRTPTSLSSQLKSHDIDAILRLRAEYIASDTTGSHDAGPGTLPPNALLRLYTVWHTWKESMHPLGFPEPADTIRKRFREISGRITARIEPLAVLTRPGRLGSTSDADPPIMDHITVSMRWLVVYLVMLHRALKEHYRHVSGGLPTLFYVSLQFLTNTAARATAILSEHPPELVTPSEQEIDIVRALFTK